MVNRVGGFYLEIWNLLCGLSHTEDDSSSIVTKFLTQLSFSSFFSWKRFLRRVIHSPSKGLDRKGLKHSRVHPHRPLMTFIKPARFKCFSPPTFFLKPTRGLRRGRKAWRTCTVGVFGGQRTKVSSSLKVDTTSKSVIGSGPKDHRSTTDSPTVHCPGPGIHNQYKALSFLFFCGMPNGLLDLTHKTPWRMLPDSLGDWLKEC